jgi:hypothetical protein
MFAWRFLDGQGEEVGTSERFPDRERAEAWMGEAWSGLVERGIEEVILVDEERGDIFRMGLEEGGV